MGEMGKRDVHVFELVEQGGKVIFFYVEGHILSSWRAEHAVPKEFGRHDVGCPCCEFAEVIDEVPTGCDSDLIGICFLGAMIDNHPCWYITTLSLGMFGMSEGSMMNIAFVPFWLVLLSP